MSSKPQDLDGTQDLSATGEFEPPAAAAGHSEQSSPNQQHPNDQMLGEDGVLLQRDVGDATAFFPPQPSEASGGVTPDGTQVLTGPSFVGQTEEFNVAASAESKLFLLGAPQESAHESAADDVANQTGEFDAAAPAASVHFLPGAPQTPATEGTVDLPSANLEQSISQTSADTPVVDGTNLDKTGVFVPAGSNDATGFYEPGSTQAPPQQSTLNRNPVATDATRVYEVGATGAPANPPTWQADDSLIGSRESKPTPTAANQCGRYVLKRFHAKGGMGEIWLAEDPGIGRPVALKRMLSQGARETRRFLVEAQVTGQLEHPGIVPIHEVGTNEQGQPFYTMKFVRGRTLQKVIDEHHAKKLSPSAREVEQFRLLQMFISVCQTVAYAHSKGVLHRDLKPENVMIGTYGEALLLDWGIAKVMGQPENNTSEGEEFVRVPEGNEDTATRAGSIMGSLSYMSPEVAAGLTNEVDERSDVYLLGGILYTILTSRPPRRGRNPVELLKKAQSKRPTAPRKINPEVHKALEAICFKALALRKEERYQTALELAEDVQRYAAGEPVTAYQEGFLARGWRWAKRHRTALTRSATAALVLSLLVFGYVKYQEIKERGAAELREAEERRQQAEARALADQREKERLEALEQARTQLKEFRNLADEARFYAATTDPVSENAPYFDPRTGQLKAKAALAVAAPWGPTLEQLPLAEEQDSVKKEMYDQLLLLAQAKIQQASEQKEAEETLALLDEAGKLHQPSRSYYRLRTQLYEHLGDENKAREAKEKAEASDTPSTSLDHFLLGEQYRKGANRPTEPPTDGKAWQREPRRLEQAIEQYRLALAIDPDHFWSHFQLGRCYLALGKLPEAVEALGACVALRPKAPWGYSVRGLALAQQKRYLEAERDLDQAVLLDPDLRPPRLNRGVLYWLQNKHDKALADFAAVLRLPSEKRLIEAAYYRGQLYLQLGKVKEALDDFDRVVAENPNFRPVYLLRARLLIAQNKNDSGLEDLNKYLSDEAGFDAAAQRGWQGHGKRGHLLRYLYLELPSEQRAKPANRALLTLAVAQLNKAVELGGQDARLFDDLGVMLEHSGQVNEALAAYTKGLEQAPKDVKLLIKRGWVLDQVKQPDKALADFAAAASIEPDNAEAHTGIGYIRALQKVSPEAQREADLALLHGAENVLILHNVACIYATLSKIGDREAVAHRNVVIALLRREIKLWKQQGTGPNALELIKGESAFEGLVPPLDLKEVSGGP